MAAKTPYYYPQSAPEYSQLPEVAGPWSDVQAPEAVDGGDTNNVAGGLMTGMPPLGAAGNWSTQQQPRSVPSSHTPIQAAYKPESQTPTTPVSPEEAPDRHRGGPRRTVLILSILVGILAAAVVGLAAATGLMAKRANDAESANPQALLDGSSCPLQTATTTVVVTPNGTGQPVAVPVADVSNGCGDDNEQISGTTYTTRIFHSITFMRHCNFQLQAFPIYGMLTPDFDACMDACAAWSYKGKDILGDKNPNAICGGVRFVPAWTDKTVAYNTNARGNCFLHAAPQKSGDLRKPNLKNGVTSHAAIVIKK